MKLPGDTEAPDGWDPEEVRALARLSPLDRPQSEVDRALESFAVLIEAVIEDHTKSQRLPNTPEHIQHRLRRAQAVQAIAEELDSLVLDVVSGLTKATEA